VRILLRILAALLGLIVAAAITVWVVSNRTLARRITVTEPAPVVPVDSASVARGRHLAVAIGKCVACHGVDLGGDQMIPGGPFARVAAANLTSGRGGVGAHRTDAQLVHAIRHGVSADGRPLFIMPSTAFRRFSDADAAAIVAYLRTLPPVDREFPPSGLGPIARALLVTGKLDGFIPALAMDHDAPRPPAPASGPTAEYGEYLVEVGACRECHGASLAGALPPGGEPDGRPSSNLTPEGLRAYDEAAFFRALREGRRPDGSMIDTVTMPVPLTRQMTDEEIRAVWAYLRTIPARPFGSN
jgi:mono/diheme cytochrome c family protein